MKLNHYLMLEAFQRRDIEEIYRLFKAQFGIGFDTSSAEVVVDDPYAGNEILMYRSNEYYSWSDAEGFYSNTFVDAINPLLRVVFAMKR